MEAVIFNEAVNGYLPMAGPRIFERTFIKEFGGNMDRYIEKRLKIDMTKWIP